MKGISFGSYVLENSQTPNLAKKIGSTGKFPSSHHLLTYSLVMQLPKHTLHLLWYWQTHPARVFHNGDAFIRYIKENNR